MPTVKLRLGVNGWRIHGMTGVPRYVSNVVSRWTPEAIAGRFAAVTLYTPKPVDRSHTQLPPTITEKVVGPPWRMLAWENLRLATVCNDDVLWCPAYTRPVFFHGKTVVTTHDATLRIHPELYSIADRTFYGPFYGWSCRHATLVLTHNETTRSNIIEHYKVPMERIRVVPLAPAEIFTHLPADRRVDQLRRRHLGGDVPFFLTVGKLSRRRNVPEIIAGFAKFKRDSGQAHKLIVVGRNTRHVDVRRIAADAGIADDLVHLRSVPDDELVLLYNGAEAFIVAATYEANSFTVIEAQATGTPVIVPDTPGMREMTGDCALIMPRVSARDIAEAMTLMASDHDLRRQLTQRGLRHAAGFSWQRTSTETLKVLEEAAGISAPAFRGLEAGRRS